MLEQARIESSLQERENTAALEEHPCSPIWTSLCRDCRVPLVSILAKVAVINLPYCNMSLFSC